MVTHDMEIANNMKVHYNINNETHKLEKESECLQTHKKMTYI